MIAILGLIAILTMVVAYPIYFLCLDDFKKALVEGHGDLWGTLKAESGGGDIQVAYGALRASRAGVLRGVKLSEKVIICRKRAVFWLYVGMMSFILLLGLGIFEALGSPFSKVVHL